MHNIALQLGPLTIYWYGIMVALGFLTGLWTASRRALRAGIHAESVVDLGPWLILGAIAGSRFLYVVSNWEDFARQPWWEVFMIHKAGLVFYGGLAGSVISGLIYVKWRKLPFLKMADILAPSVALGHAFGRIGCLMSGCCFGKPTQCAWAIHFPSVHETHGAGVHPTQIYEAVLNLILYLALAALFRRKKYEGQVFVIYLMAYAVLRATVECFRGDYAFRNFGGWLTPGQVASVMIFILGAALWWYLPKTNSPAIPKPTHS